MFMTLVGKTANTPFKFNRWIMAFVTSNFTFSGSTGEIIASVSVGSMYPNLSSGSSYSGNTYSLRVFELYRFFVYRVLLDDKLLVSTSLALSLELYDGLLHLFLDCLSLVIYQQSNLYYPKSDNAERKENYLGYSKHLQAHLLVHVLLSYNPVVGFFLIQD